MTSLLKRIKGHKWMWTQRLFKCSTCSICEHWFQLYSFFLETKTMMLDRTRRWSPLLSWRFTKALMTSVDKLYNLVTLLEWSSSLMMNTLVSNGGQIGFNFVLEFHYFSSSISWIRKNAYSNIIVLLKIHIRHAKIVTILYSQRTLTSKPDLARPTLLTSLQISKTSISVYQMQLFFGKGVNSTRWKVLIVATNTCMLSLNLLNLLTYFTIKFQQYDQCLKR